MAQAEMSGGISIREVLDPGLSMHVGAQSNIPSSAWLDGAGPV